MKMSTKGRYGLRIMLELALNYGQKAVIADTIAQNQQISANYIHLLVKTLRDTGLINAARGPNGGYLLARPPADINVLQIVVALEGKIRVVDCAAGGEGCIRTPECVVREVWEKLNRSVEDTLKEITLEQLVLRHGQALRAQHDYQI
ncbi:Rrf2 family transcriptional regulator [Erysipelotrichia bacterium]